MYHIKFKYKDKYTRGEWAEQECDARSLEECMDFYGLGVDCEYEIINITPIKKEEGQK